MIRSATMSVTRDDRPMRGRIISVSYALSTTGNVGARDVEIHGAGYIPSVGDEFTWVDHGESWQGTLERVEPLPKHDPVWWKAWGSAYLMERPDV